MKVLITTDWYLPSVNGVVTSVMNLQKQLLARGVDVRILTLSEDGNYHREGNVIYLPSVDISRIYPGARARLRPVGKAAEELIRWHPDIVHSQCEFSTFLAARKIAKACRCPQIHTYHTMYEDFIHYVSPSTLFGRRGAQILTASVCRKVQHIIVPSEKTRELLCRYHVRTPITCIPTGVETGRFSEDIAPETREKLRSHYGITKENVVLIYIGRLAVEKNLDEVLYMFSRRASPVNKLVLVGDGPYRKELEYLVRELKLTDSVIFTGMVPPQNIAAFYRMGDVFVSASRSETQGLTYFEAMASGLPLLCVDDPCLENVLLAGENGFTYRDEREYAQFLHLLTESADLREIMGRHGKEIVQSEYSAESFAQAVMNVYQKVMSTCCHRGRGKIYGAAAKPAG